MSGNLSAIMTGGDRPPKVLVNAMSTSGQWAQQLYACPDHKLVASGALTANVLAPVLSITGAGAINAFGCMQVDTTSRSHRLKCTIDGVVVFDSTTLAAVNAAGCGISMIGSVLSNTLIPVLDQIRFNSSLLIEYASSVTETAKTNFQYKYRTY